MVWRMAALAVLLASPLLYFGQLGIFAGAAVVIFVLEGSLLLAHFNRIYRLRYLRNQPQLALAEFRPWKLILDSFQYQLLRGELLVQAEQYSLVEQVIVARSTSDWLRHHLQYVLARQQDDPPRALAELTRVLEIGGTAEQLATSQGEMARFLAEHYPERLGEAFRLLDLCRPHFENRPPMPDILRGIEGTLLIAGGAAEAGCDQLDATLRVLRPQEAKSPHLAPVIADFWRWRGRAQWALGQEEQARIDLLRAREAVNLPRVHERLDRDLARLRRGELLMPEPTPEVVALVEERQGNSQGE